MQFRVFFVLKRTLWMLLSGHFPSSKTTYKLLWNSKNVTVPCNVGLLCNISPGTSLCNLGTNYAMLMPQNLIGYQKISWYCSQQLLPVRTLKTGSVVLFIHIQWFLHHIFNESTACSLLIEDFLHFPQLRVNQFAENTKCIIVKRTLNK